VAEDHVDSVLEAWRQEAPGLDTSPIAVSERLRRLSTLLERQMEPVLTETALTAGEVDVLATLRRSGSPFRLTPTSLTTTLMLTSGGMTKRLSTLEHAGLIRRVSNPNDRRSRAVELTDEGRRLVERVLESRFKNEKRLLTTLRKRQRRDLATALRDLCVALGDERPPPKIHR
jgi:DNA-binding MarR family transcriptional regulator